MLDAAAAAIGVCVYMSGYGYAMKGTNRYLPNAST